MAFENQSKSDIREDDLTIGVIKWTLLFLIVMTAVFTLFVVRQHWLPKERRDIRSYTIICHSIFGFILVWFGFYSAFAEQQVCLVIFASLLMLDIVLAIFVKEHMKVCAKINLSLYTSCAVLAFIEAHQLQTIIDKFIKQ